MSNLLYYPHYTPSKKRLRTLLLFFDTVDLIVPRDDQPNVIQRDHVKPLLNVDESILRFHAPEDGYGRWAENREAIELLTKIIDEVRTKDPEIALEKYAVEPAGRLVPGVRDSIVPLLFKLGWRPVALQKINRDVFKIIVGAGLGARIGMYRRPGTNEIVEQDATILHPAIAAFVFSRLSREISDREHVPTMTFGTNDYFNHTFDGFDDLRRDPPIDLLRTSVPLIIPDKVGSMPTATFFSIREDFGDLRSKLHRHMGDFVSKYRLNNESATTDYLRRLEFAAREISREVEVAQTNDHVFSDFRHARLLCV